MKEDRWPWLFLGKGFRSGKLDDELVMTLMMMHEMMTVVMKLLIKDE